MLTELLLEGIIGSVVDKQVLLAQVVFLVHQEEQEVGETVFSVLGDEVYIGVILWLFEVRVEVPIGVDLLVVELLFELLIDGRPDVDDSME